MIHEHRMTATMSSFLRRLTARFLQIKISRHFLDHAGRHSFAMSNEGGNQRMLAE